MTTWITDDMDIDNRKYALPKSLLDKGIRANFDGSLIGVQNSHLVERYRLETRDELIWFILHKPRLPIFFDYKDLSLTCSIRQDTPTINVGLPTKYVNIELSNARHWEGVCVLLDVIEKLAEFEIPHSEDEV